MATNLFHSWAGHHRFISNQLHRVNCNLGEIEISCFDFSKTASPQKSQKFDLRPSNFLYNTREETEGSIDIFLLHLDHFEG